MRYMILLLALVCGSAYGQDWAPPENPDPDAILQEASADARAGRYKTALAKHVWYHENVLAINPAHYGVRLSFALSDWNELGNNYPPAREKLKEVRDQAKRKVLDGKDVHEAFHDLKSINEQLGDEAMTKQVFETLDEKHPEAARKVFQLAKPALVQAKAYSLFAKYVKPSDDLARMIEMYKHDKQLAEDPRFGADHLAFANKQFANNVQTLVAVLAVTDRKEEAKKLPMRRVQSSRIVSFTPD